MSLIHTRASTGHSATTLQRHLILTIVVMANGPVTWMSQG